MIQLIADSGSTSAKWCLKSNSRIETYYSHGLNPYYHRRESLSNIINTEVLPRLNGRRVDKLYFYGAGCDGAIPQEMLQKSLHQGFPEASITVEHDLLGSARACFFDRPGIACILGTGSNSCRYDGSGVVEHRPSLGFILGDEASAGYFGRKLINRYFRGELPADLEASLKDSYNMNLQHIKKQVYKGAQPSRFVASYAKFLGEHPDHPFVNKMLREGFRNFIIRLIKKYNGAQNHAIGFVGSVAYVHRKLIKEILLDEGLTPGVFLKNPLKRLIEFHSE